MNENDLCSLRLIRSENVGPATFHALVARYGSAKNVLEALPHIARKGGRKDIRVCSEGDALKEWDDWHRYGGGFLFSHQENYPSLLKKIGDHPPVLCYLGNLEIFHKKTFAIVGTRHASVNGLKLARYFAQVLGRRGYSVASGLALGIDGAVHEGSLDTGTIAVVAGGCDVIYPPSHAKLHKEICARGLVISEHGMGVVPQRRMFPRRNRIISGLSLGVLVVEASLASGSLITAQYALEQGRDVFSVPGSPLDERARGSNKLIKEGAIFVESPEDLLPFLEGSSVGTVFDEELSLIINMKNVAVQDMEVDSVHEADVKERILACLTSSPVLLDDIVSVLKCQPEIVHGLVAELELVGFVQRHIGGRVSLI